jgi:hypothetical protein
MGLEYITQPQVFLAGLTALGGINGSTPPFYTSFYTWTTATSEPIFSFYLDNPNVALLDIPSSYIVSVGGVVQSPSQYSIDIFNRTIFFNEPVNEDTEISVTQIGTVAVSTIDVTGLTAENSFLNNVTASNLQVTSSIFDNVTATELTVLSSTIEVTNTVVIPVSVVSLTAIDFTVFDQDVSITGVLYTSGGNSTEWESTYETVSTLSSNWNFGYDVATYVQANSASWEESAEILPTVTNYLSTELVNVSSLNVTEQLLSASTDLFDLFLTPNNTLTTSVCAMSGDGVTPFVMQFTDGLLTSVTV